MCTEWTKLPTQPIHTNLQIDVKVKVHGGDATKGPRDQVTEVTVYTFRNGVVRVVERAENLYASIDLVSDKLARSLRKLKEKALPKGKWPGHRATVKGGKVITQVCCTLTFTHIEQTPKIVIHTLVPSPCKHPFSPPPQNQVLKDTEVLDELPTDKTASLPPEVIRTKHFVLEPMDVEEAVEQLQFMSHDFFLFQDRATRAVQVGWSVCVWGGRVVCVCICVLHDDKVGFDRICWHTQVQYSFAYT